MKRSAGSPNLSGGSKKRFDSNYKLSTMHTQNQFHHQAQHVNQQEHYAVVSAAMAASQQYSSNCGNQSGAGLMAFQHPSNYAYSLATPGMHSRMWKYSLPTTPATTPRGYDVRAHAPPPLPLESPQKSLQPPLPGSEHDSATGCTSQQMGAFGMVNMTAEGASHGTTAKDKTLVRKKYKRKSISNRLNCPKVWNRDDALRAIALEKEYARKEKSEILLLRFPDPELSRDIVSKYSKDIASIHFQQNTAPRSCFVYLKEDADADTVIETISKIPFGTGFVKAEYKHNACTEVPPPVNAEDVDPYTLYIGNLPASISSKTVKEQFPSAHRIDIGFAQRMKHTRYAFVRYHTAEEALESFRKSANAIIDSRSVIVRFRRQRGDNKVATSSASTSSSISGISGVQNAVELAQTEERLTSELISERLPVPAVTNTEQTDVHSISSEYDSLNSSVTALPPARLIEEDSKANMHTLMQQMEHKAAIAKPVSTAVRRNSVEDLFNELDRRQQLGGVSTTVKITTAVGIKQEHNYDDERQVGNESLVNLLGARYSQGERTIKAEPETTPSPTNNDDLLSNTGSEYGGEFEKDTDEEDDDNWSAGLSTVNSIRSEDNATEKFDDIRKVERDCVEEKPNVQQLQSSKRGNCLPIPFPTQSTEMTKLYEQQRKFRERELANRPRDDLDDMFARMESDDDDDYGYF